MIGMAEIRRGWDRSRNEQIWKRGPRRRKAPNGCGMALQGRQREVREELGDEIPRFDTATMSIAIQRQDQSGNGFDLPCLAENRRAAKRLGADRSADDWKRKRKEKQGCETA